MYDITTLQKQNKKTRNIHKDMDCPIDIIHYLHTQTYIHEIYTYWVPLLKQNYKKIQSPTTSQSGNSTK